MFFTPTVELNWANLKRAVETSTCILVQGELGSGKSVLVSELSKEMKQHDDMIHVNVDDSFDSKDLLGKFSATDVPGTFQWVAGPLTTAVQMGYWILMEDIDLASFDVFSVILPLLESSTLFLPDKNCFIAAHPNFKLIATQQLVASGQALFSRKSNSVPFAELWGAVLLQNLPSNEVCQILSQAFPSVGNEVTRNLAELSESIGNAVSLRTLAQWCKRVSQQLSLSQSKGFMSSVAREIMLLEAYDCFAARFPPGFERTRVMSLIAEACGVSQNIAEPMLLEHKPAEMRQANSYSIGRISIALASSSVQLSRDSRIAFAPTKQALCLLEQLAAAVKSGEHVLLTGETGVGKTFIVQYLADQLGKNLVVHNLNQQTDSSDFMGGWKPLDVGVMIKQLYFDFLDAFNAELDSGKNVRFLDALQKDITERKWERALRLIIKGCASVKSKPRIDAEEPENSGASLEVWATLQEKAEELLDTVGKTKTSFAFSYEEGSLVKAWRNGDWILLDELNLATTEVLERVAAVLGDVDKLFLTDKGDAEPVMRHPNFHVFANMNPPTDVGKKDLPPSLRSRFTELYVSEPFNKNDVIIVVTEYIGFLTADARIDEVANFFLDCVQNASTKLCSIDGESKPPSFSLRTLTRALTYVRKATPFYGFLTALYDGLLLGFATPLQRQFHEVIESLIIKNVFRGNRPNPPRLPAHPPSGKFTPYEHVWVPSGEREVYCDEGFILTNSVKGHLVNLARAVFANRPVLLEGPTSSGKSSMIKYLAELTGNTFVRINNHDSTEVQEYLGHYVTDEYGKLRFVDGILVTAVRNGYWVVLDELNLAPTDVLEALNRLLDDNCELFIPDTQETIKPHPQLRIFATQNPAGLYGGRKMLSRAFRNRFLEITVDEIPTSELSFILVRRYALPQTFADNMVEIMSALQVRRQESQIFAGKHGFITPRDLFRWAERRPQTFQELAEHGFLLLGERCRKEAEQQIVKDVIEKVTKTEINTAVLYSPDHWPFVRQYYANVESGIIDSFQIIWTPSMQRLFTIVGICLQHQEPVLLVGETGSSKTTVCQLWAALLGLPIHILNCHQHTEAADFLGSLRPTPPDRRDDSLFEWRNGPLVDSMLSGDIFVLDEISLTEDSVLERLNSVLEPSRSITLAEKSSADYIEAHSNFRVLATMNPGGDFGKKELSPALRNRFTEVYVRPVAVKEEVELILAKRLAPELQQWAPKMAEILCAVSRATASSGIPQHISIRDIIGWVQFMNATNGTCDAEDAFMEGLDAIILEGIGVGTGQSDASNTLLRKLCIAEAFKTVPTRAKTAVDPRPFWEVVNNMERPRMPREKEHTFIFDVPATQRNLSKLVRAGVLKKATLLEGSPGVGKTTIVEALGCALGRDVVRINLSEQTDIMDLFGTYLPSPNPEADGPRFAWSDGVLLRAVKCGSWVILDELNLASQSVLEGLNALLDHRSTVFIPELNKEFTAHPDFRVFACQNPLIEGGGRKGLPRSFLNRFVKVRIEAFEVDDLLCIARSVCSLDDATVAKMVYFVGELQHETMVRRSFGHRGTPWEFNLRDVLRWAKFLQVYGSSDPAYFAQMLFLERMRCEEDRAACEALLSKYFDLSALDHGENADFLISTDDDVVHLRGRALCRRVNTCDPLAAPPPRLLLLPSQTDTVRSLLLCAQHNQFALVVGPAGAGKSYAIRAAAALMNAKLVTFSITASCDTVDLLGGFDQVEGKQGQFQWKDSLVLEAMERGYWLILDNVNYCSASVLDRLNPLVEPNGYLSINEQGLVNDAIRVVRPHPNFRLFATLNPQFGEISRAMRNRAVELFVVPVQIPSVESVALSSAQVAVPAAECRDSSSSSSAVFASLLATAAEFHRAFVASAFGADTTVPGSSKLTDSLSYGAPNVFTLLRTVKMLVRSIGTVGGGESENPQEAVDQLASALAHCYIHNRGGAWRTRQAEMETLLGAVVREASEALKRRPGVRTPAYPPLHLARSALELAPGSLAERRAYRSLLPALTASASEAATVEFDLSSVLIRCVLEQTNDSAPLGEVSAARHALLPSVTADEETLGVVGKLFGEQYCSPAHFERLLSVALAALGPHREGLEAAVRLAEQGGNISDSVVVNTRMRDAMATVVALLRSGGDPLRGHEIMKYLHVFVAKAAANRVSLNSSGYVVVLTFLLLLRADVDELFARNASHVAESAHTALVALQESIVTYLGLPFAGGAALDLGESPLSRHVTRPHITTVEERDSFNQWMRLGTAGCGGGSGNTDTRMDTYGKQKLRGLTEVVAFRAEFALIQSLLKLRQPSREHSVATTLRDEVGSFVQCFTHKLPFFAPLETALWQALLSVAPTARQDSAGAACEEFIPLLVNHFIAYFGLDGVRHVFPANWACAATACLRYASRVSVSSIGDASSDHARALQGTVACCRTLLLSRSPSLLLSDWEASTRQELSVILQSCFPSLAEHPGPSAGLSATLPHGGVVGADVNGGDSLFLSNKALLEAISFHLGENKSDVFVTVALIWILKCRLLIPLSPIDPMFALECKMGTSTAEQAALERLQLAFEWSEAVMMHRLPSKSVDSIANLRSHQAGILAEAKMAFSERPDRTGERYATLIRRLYQISSNHFSDDKVALLAAGQGGASAAQARRTWSELVFQEVSDVLACYGGYEDATMNFAEAALFAATAIRASCYTEASAASSEDSSGTLFSLRDTVLLLQYPTRGLRTLPLPRGRLSKLTVRRRLTLLSSYLDVLCGSVSHNVDRQFAEDVFASFSEVYDYVKHLEEKEREEERMSVLYKEKTTVIEGDDEKLLRHLKLLLPNYEEEFIIPDAEIAEAGVEEPQAQHATEPGEDEDDETRDHLGRQARLIFKEKGGVFIRRLVHAHAVFYRDMVSNSIRNGCNHGLLSRSFTERFDILSNELQRFSPDSVLRSLPLSEEQLLSCGFMHRASLLSADVRQTTASGSSVAEKKAEGFNIFVDTDPFELSRFSKPLQNLLGAIENLLRQYPDSVALQRCHKIGTRLAHLPALSTPLMKVMTGSEILLKECYEWERNASHEVSLMDHMVELSAFVLRWRRLELHCWPFVFKAKKDEILLNASVEWFSLRRLLQSYLEADRAEESHEDDDDGGDDDAPSTGGAAALVEAAFHRFTDFVWNATYGDFSLRLSLIRSFGFEAMARQGYFSPLAHLCLHMSAFFGQFEEFVSSRCRALVQPIEDDIKDFAKIMRWEDANYYAVRATAEKSHLKIARVLGSLDEALRTPILGAINAEEQRCVDDPAMGFAPIVVPAAAAAKKTAKGGAVRKSGQKRDRAGKPLANRNSATGSHSVEKQVEVEQNASVSGVGQLLQDSREFFSSSANDIIERVKQLQTAKTPQQVKIRSLKTLFDTIEESGIPLAHEGTVDPWSIHFATTEAMTACHSVHDESEGSVALSKAACNEHSRFGRWLERLREAHRKPHPDLSGAQAQRARSVSEFLFLSEVEMSALTTGCSRLLTQLRVLSLALNEELSGDSSAVLLLPDDKLGSAAGGDGSDDADTALDAALGICCDLQIFNEEADKLRSLAEEEPSNEVMANIGEMRKLTADLWAQSIRYEPLRRYACKRAPLAVLRSTQDTLERLHALSTRLLHSDAAIFAAAASAIEPRLRAALHTCQVATGAAAASSTAAGDNAPLLTRLERFLSHGERLLSADVVFNEKRNEDANEEAGAEEAVMPIYKEFQQRFEFLKSSVDGMLEDYSDGGEFPLHLLRSLSRSTLASLSERVRMACDTVEEVRATMLHALFEHAHFSHVLTRLFTVLMSKGFCKPEDQDEEEGEGEGEGQQQNGTGMDDGQGEKDVTDEIENEDQLMNMKDKEEQQEQKEDKKGEGDDDEEEEDNAADVETDFQAQKESRPEDEDDDDGDEEDESESDKEMGSVDGEEAQERKKQKKDKGDQNDMSEDDEEGADAQEVPEDELNDESGLDEETGGFQDKAEEIRDADEDEDKRQGEKDIIGDDEKDRMEDDETDGDSSGAEKSDDEGEDKEETATDDDLDNANEEAQEEKSDGSESHMEDDASTDGERSVEGERELEQEEGDSGSDNEDDDGEEKDGAKDGLDENVFEGGQQDDEIGKENTERQQEEDEDDKARPKPQDATGTEQEQPGDEQEQDDAGRNWKKQDDDNNKSAKRKDNTERNRSQHNPYKAVKEALQRHNNNVQQLNLNKLAEVKDDNDDNADERDHDQHPPPPENEEEEIDDFHFDEKGDREGMAATDDNQKPQHDPSSASDEVSSSAAEDDDEDDERNFKEDAELPQDSKRKRAREDDQEQDGAEDANAKDSKDKRNKKRSKKEVQVTAKPEEPSDDDESAVKREPEDDEEPLDDKLSRGRRLWEEQEAAVQGLSQQLCEQLRLILAPTLADKLQGDYKTGKRLNMKRIIPYIASQFKKDRIWLRRTKPNKRTYQVMVALDDSLSMTCNNAGVFSCRSVALIAKALQQLEVGEIGIVSFGKEPNIIHPLEEAFVGDSGPRAFSEVTFKQTSTNMRLFLERTLDYLDQSRERMYGQTRSTTEHLQQVLFIISDGQITEDRTKLRELVGRAEKNNQMVVFVLLDIKASSGDDPAASSASSPAAPLSASDLKGLSAAERMRRLKADRESRLKRVQSNSVLDMQLVEFKNGKVVTKLYMEDFPFPYYLVVRDLENLPSIIADAMRQWFELLNSGLQ